MSNVTIGTKSELMKLENLSKKHIDGLVVINVERSNPNGDPQNDGHPRVGVDGCGVISHVAMKRKIRDLIENKENAKEIINNIKKCSGIEINGNIGLEILESHVAKGLFGENLSAILNMPVDEMLGRYFDARIFGCTLLSGKAKEQDNTDTSEKKGKKKSDRGKCLTMAGPFQFQPSKSLCPVEVLSQTISKKTGIEEGKDRGLANGGLTYVDHGVYIMKFQYIPYYGEKCMTTDDDVRITLECLPHMFNASSLNRTGVTVQNVILGVHNNRLGSFNTYDFWVNSCPIPKNFDVPSKSLADYEFADLSTALQGMEGQFFSYKM